LDILESRISFTIFSIWLSENKDNGMVGHWLVYSQAKEEYGDHELSLKAMPWVMKIYLRTHLKVILSLVSLGHSLSPPHASIVINILDILF
jgi:hypothetical protein